MQNTYLGALHSSKSFLIQVFFYFWGSRPFISYVYTNYMHIYAFIVLHMHKNAFKCISAYICTYIHIFAHLNRWRYHNFRWCAHNYVYGSLVMDTRVFFLQSVRLQVICGFFFQINPHTQVLTCICTHPISMSLNFFLVLPLKLLHFSLLRMLFSGSDLHYRNQSHDLPCFSSFRERGCAFSIQFIYIVGLVWWLN